MRRSCYVNLETSYGKREYLSSRHSGKELLFNLKGNF